MNTVPIEEVHQYLAAVKRIKEHRYESWMKAGGPSECLHGIAQGIPCAFCDQETIKTFREKYQP